MKDQYLSREELQALFRDSLTEEVNEEGPPVLFEDDEDLGKCVDLGLQMLDAFILRVPRPDQVLEVERAFVLELAHPVTGEIAPVPLIGAMDAIVVDEGKTAVWELKTGKKKWSADQLEYDPQTTAYVMAARELGYEDPERQAAGHDEDASSPTCRSSGSCGVEGTSRSSRRPHSTSCAP